MTNGGERMADDRDASAEDATRVDDNGDAPTEDAMRTAHADGKASAAPLVSIIVPAYNAARYIDPCLASIREQTYRALEIIVVDDGSTDDTLERVQAHAVEDERITVLTQQNLFAGVARNYGFSRAQGDYVMFLDADDIFDPAMVERLVDRAQAAEADVVVCRSDFYDDATGELEPIEFCLRYVDTSSVFSGTDLSEVMFRFCNGWPWDKLYRADFVRDKELAFQDSRTTNDAYFVFMALMLAERIAFVDESLVQHRTNNAGSLERTRVKSWDNAMRAALAIEDGMKRFGIYETFEQSFLNWFLNFSLWNFETLEGEVRDGLLAEMERLIAPRLPADPPDGFYFEARDAQVASLLHATPFEMLRRGIELEIELKREKDGIEYLHGWIDATEREVRLRDEEIARLIAVNRELLESTSYKAGQAVTAVPRAIKDAFSKKDGQ